MGLGVILISSELPEVIGLSDRIIVMKSLKVAGEVSREEATESKLLSLGMIERVNHEKYGKTEKLVGGDKLVLMGAIVAVFILFGSLNSTSCQ